MAGGQSWGANSGPWLSFFLDAIRRSIIEGPFSGGKMTYIAYQTWLSRNDLIFNVEIVPTHRMLERACYVAMDYSRFDVASLSLIAPNFWDSLAAHTAIRMVLLIFWGSLSKDLSRLTSMAMLEMAEVVRILSFRAWMLDCWLLAAGGSPLFELFVLE